MIVRRTILRACLRATAWLAVGLVITVAVAWGFAAAGGWDEPGPQFRGPEAAAKGWPVVVPSDWDSPDLWQEGRRRGHRVLLVTGANVDLAHGLNSILWGRDQAILIEDAGWPLHALRSTRFEMYEGSPRNGSGTAFVSVRVGIVRSRFVAGAQGDFIEYFPVDPLWAGFIVNCLFYTAVVWAALSGPLLIKRWLRRRRGLCPACGYPVGASPVCTECGLPSPLQPR